MLILTIIGIIFKMLLLWPLVFFLAGYQQKRISFSIKHVEKEIPSDEKEIPSDEKILSSEEKMVSLYCRKR